MLKRERPLTGTKLQKSACVVFIRGPSGLGSALHDYRVLASNSLEAAAMGVDLHTQSLTSGENSGRDLELTEESVFTVVVNGSELRSWNYAEKNAKRPMYRHSIAQVKACKARHE